jgi:hypothetical protein
MQTGFLSISQVATLIGVRKHRIEYALSEGYVSEPKMRFLNKRLFDPSEVCAVASYFGQGRRHENENESSSGSSLRASHNSASFSEYQTARSESG